MSQTEKMGIEMGRMARTEGVACAKVRGGKELGRWSTGPGNGAQGPRNGINLRWKWLA